jgi:hypothetical protein
MVFPSCLVLNTALFKTEHPSSCVVPQEKVPQKKVPQKNVEFVRLPQ